MFKKIIITGEISEESYGEFSVLMTKAIKNDKVRRISIELTSSGGCAFAALAYYEAIRRCPKPVEVVGTGIVASAAVIILAAGHKRYMTPSCWVMVHEDEVILDEGTRVSQAEKQIKTSRRIEDQWCRLLSAQTTITIKEWQELHSREEWLTPEVCKDLGLIHEVLK